MFNFIFKYQKILLHFFCALCFLQTGAAQVFSNYKRYTAENGLPSSHVYNIIQDKNDFIWIATDQGVAKFDGYSFQHFTAKDGLPSNDVWSLAEDKKGRIWLSTFNEVGYLFEDKYHRVEMGDSLETNGILTHRLFQRENEESHYITWRRLLKVEDDSVFVVSKKEVYGENEDNSFILESIRDDLLHLHLNLGIDENGRDWFLFLGNNKGDTMYFFYRDKKGAFHYVKKKIIGKRVKFSQVKVHFFPEHSRSIIQMYDVFYSFDFEKVERILTFENEKISTGINSFKLNKDEFAVQKKQVIVYNLKTGEKRELQVPKNEIFHTITEDANGNIWMASGYGVVFLSKEKNLVSYLKNDKNKIEESFVSNYKDKKNRIWFGTDNGRLFYLDSLRQFREVEIILNSIKPNSDILGIVDNPNGGITVGGNFGLLNITEKGIADGKIRRIFLPILQRKLSIKDSLHLTSVLAKNLFYDGKEKIYVGSSDGYFVYSEKSPLFLVNLRERKERVYSIIKVPDGVTYLGRKSGLYQLREGVEELLLPIPIGSLFYDKNGLWVGTEGGGIYLLKGEEQIHFPETAGKTIKAIKPDEEGNIWFITENDICRIRTVGEGEKEYDLSFSGTANGLSVSLINDLIIKDETVYFCTIEGVQKVPLSIFNWGKTKRNLFFTDIQINGSSVEMKENYDLGYEENCLAINYVSLEYNKPEKVNYEYKMEGLDTLWHSSSGLKQEFWFLQPGQYNFSLRAGFNSQNVSEIKNISFYIKAPWWQRPLTWVLIGLVVIGAVTLQIRRIIRSASERAKVEEQIADMRLQALQSQMNPHFIFNSLQAIQDYIFDKDEEQANRYLVKFSRLMRLILESSRKKFILLSEELKLIELYVSLEQLRFGEQFSYEVSIDENIDRETLFVPSMLIQPFIENAVNHGLFHKKDGQGHLKLSMTKSGNCLTIIVEDNGIGLKAAEKIKQKMKRKEASRALEIVRERTSLYNKTTEEDINFQIEDRLNEKGEICGTKVILQLILSDKKVE